MLIVLVFAVSGSSFESSRQSKGIDPQHPENRYLQAQIMAGEMEAQVRLAEGSAQDIICRLIRYCSVLDLADRVGSLVEGIDTCVADCTRRQLVSFETAAST